MVRRSISLIGSAALCCTTIAAISSDAFGSGVCCVPGLTCTVANNAADCSGLGWVYKGDGTTCSPTNPCVPPSGACCIHLSALQPPPYATGGGRKNHVTWLPPTGTFSLSGVPHITSVVCLPESTAGPFDFGGDPIICAVLSEAGCTTNGGTYHGDNSACTATLCAPPSTATGACCRVATGAAPTCTTTTQAQCASGTWTSGASCATTPCNPPTGACCRVDYCLVNTATACALAHMIYKGDGTTCNATTCPPPVLGTCCRPASPARGAYCEVTYNIACPTASFTAGQTSCATVTCADACPCDWDRDGFVTGSDLLAFLSDFYAGHADYDHNNMTNNADYTAFVQCYSGAPTSQCIHR